MANIVELRELSDEEIKEALEEAREEMFNLRFQKATGSLENTARIGQVKREIAQLSELLRKREWAVEEAAKVADIAAALEGKEWTGEARYDYEEGYHKVVLSDENGKELATADVDLNKKRRRTRRHRSDIPPVLKVDSYEVA